MYMYVYMCVCECVCVDVHIHTHIATHTRVSFVSQFGIILRLCDLLELPDPNVTLSESKKSEANSISNACSLSCILRFSVWHHPTPL